VGVLPLLGCLASGLGFVVEEADLDGDIVEEERFVFFVRLYARYMFFTKSPETCSQMSRVGLLQKRPSREATVATIAPAKLSKCFSSKPYCAWLLQKRMMSLSIS